MISAGCILWLRAGDNDPNDMPYLVLQANDIGVADFRESGTINFLCLETADQFTLEQPTIARLIRDQLAYFTGDVG